MLWHPIQRASQKTYPAVIARMHLLRRHQASALEWAMTLVQTCRGQGNADLVMQQLCRGLKN